MSSSSLGGRPDPAPGRPPPVTHPSNATPGAVVTAVVVLAVFVAFLLPVADFNVHARRLPLVVGVPAVALAAVNVVRQWIRWRRACADCRRAGEALPDVVTRLRGLITPREGDATSVVVAIGWITAAVAAILLLGFLWGAIAFMPAFMILYGKERLRSVLLYAGGVLAVLYLAFIVGLNVPYFPGIFAG